MTTLYKPVLIETVEQVKALPDTAIVIGVETGERYTRTFEGDWWGVTEMGTRLAVDLDAGDVVTALVPIEAEEETRLHVVRPGARTTTADLTRLVTPWEAVS